jgi:acyl-ACP thioesterase
VNYLEWALESMPESWLNSHRLSAFEINFRAESNFGDKVDVSSQEVETVGSKMALHVLHRQSDGRELARLRSFWVNR